MKVTESDGKALVRLARSAVSCYLDRRETIEPPRPTPESFKKRNRVFVTILTQYSERKERIQELRGCIGFLEARQSLGNATISAAINAATADPRFPPMNSSELGNVVFEVNVLGEPSLLELPKHSEYPTAIVIGTDGLIVVNGKSRGILLPEVPVEWGWTSEEFLGECCLKAGLYPDSWLDPQTRVYKFQSEIFREIEPMGHIERRILKR